VSRWETALRLSDPRIVSVVDFCLVASHHHVLIGCDIHGRTKHSRTIVEKLGDRLDMGVVAQS
jgi:hypothetical protein